MSRIIWINLIQITDQDDNLQAMLSTASGVLYWGC